MRARDLMQQIARAAWRCADPGVQYDTTINRWHTCKESGRINASNPCSEYMFLDDSACNLASINLMKFVNDDGSFNIDGFRHAVTVFILAQEIIVDFASYPTQLIAEQQPRLPPARARLREPRHAAHGARDPLRLARPGGLAPRPSPPS